MDNFMKICIHCNNIKPLSEFAKDKRNKDGYGSECLLCARERLRIYESTPEGKIKRTESKRKYKKTPKGKISESRYRQSEKNKIRQALYLQTDKCKETKRKYTQKRRDQLKQTEEGKLQLEAGYAINRAVASDKIPPASSLKCVYCENQAANYHHHKGYEKKYWFCVEPVCTICHNHIHHNSNSKDEI